MSSVQASTSQKEGMGSGVFIALAPWVLFTVVANHSTLKVASALALVASVLIAGRSIRAGSPKELEIGAVISFIAFTAIAFFGDASLAHWVERYARAIAAAFLALIAFVSLLRVPFTEQYAREQVPPEYWGTPRFKAINRRLTTMWVGIFALMVPGHVIAGIADTRATNIIFNWVVPIGLVLYGIKQSEAAGDDGEQS